MTEKAVVFGRERNLVGVLSTAPGNPAERPAVLLLNAGLVHRVGPFRMTVDLARHLTELGFDVLRYDQSGLGDSAPRRESGSFEERALDDASDAMDLLGRLQGRATFIVSGLCAGAASAHRIVAADHRVVGAAFIDGFTIATPQFWVRRLLYRAVSPSRWRNVVRRRLGRAEQPGPRAAGPRRPDDERRALFEMTHLPEHQVARDLRAFVERSVRMLFVYTSGLETRYNAEDQLFEAVPELRGRAEVAYYPMADHTFTLLADRQELLDRVCRWVQTHFGEATPAAARSPARDHEPGTPFPGLRERQRE